MDIIPKLNLNKHPKDCDNNSLVYAKNIRLNNNGINLTIDEQLKDIETPEGDIVGVISCNKELVLFITKTNSNYINIYRYDENTKEIELSCENIEYEGGEIIGTFTYNVNNELIIAYSEYGENLNIPIKTLNLKGFGEKIDINNELLPLNPEVIIPTINTEIITGSAYKGWYYIFIRYKYNNEYTQWYNTNSSVFIDSYSTDLLSSYFVSDQQISVYGASTVTESIYDTPIVKDDKQSYIFDNFKVISRKEDIVSTSFKCVISNIDNIYNSYQLGFINIRKDTSKAFKTFDIDVNNLNFIFNHSLIEDYTISELLDTYINYYNVKNIINYNNRLYISNYKENNINKKIEESDITCTLELIEDNYQNNIEIFKNLILKGKYKNININNNIDAIPYDGYYTFDLLDYFVINDLNTSNSSSNEEIQMMLPPIDILSNIINKNIKVENIGSVSINDKYYKLEEIYNFKISTNDELVINDDTKISLTNNDIKIRFYSQSNNLLDLEEVIPVKEIACFIIPSLNNTTINDELLEILYNENKIKINDNTKAVLNSCGILPNEEYNFYIHFIDKYGQITNGYNLNKFNIKLESDDKLELNNNLIKIKNINLPELNNSININNFYKYTISCTLNKLPQNYIGFFISYEKLEKRIIFKGVSKLFSIEKDENNNYQQIIINFYSSDLIANDKINIDITKLRIYETSGIQDTFLLNNEFITYTNYKFKDEGGTEKLNRIRRDYILEKASTYYDFDIEECYLESKVNGVYLKLQIKINDNTIAKINSITDFKFYIAELRNDEKTLYNNDNKLLIPASNITYDTKTIINTKNAFNTVISSLYFKSHIFNNSTILFTPDGNIGIEDGNILNFNYADYLELPQESFIINNEPVIYFSPTQGLNDTDDAKKAFIKSKILEGKNYVDLYKQPNVTYLDLYPKILTNFKENINNIEIFNKTLRRSNVIQSESLENAWRKFNLEEYKIITENKGNITNIIGIGYYLFVHTEHSLFAFNVDNIMKTENKDIQLATLDVFDLVYKEIFTSQFGYAGLQDSKAFIVDTFGYIYYDNDSNRFYQFDNNQLNLIDEDIANWLMCWKPTKVRFVNDFDNNRILINLTLKDNTNTTLSYNYLSKSFISFHDINFSKGINTKNNLYILDENKILKTINKNKYVTESFINIIVNAEYETIKFLESIIYKLYKNNNNIAFDNIPVEGQLYSGDTLRIYNNSVDTKEQSISSEYDGVIEINKFNNYKLPYYYLGNWHFNYLRDNSREENTTDIDKRSRLYGNYFKLLFKFTTNEEIPFEFESLNYIIKNK